MPNAILSPVARADCTRESVQRYLSRYGARAATVRTIADLAPVRSWVGEGASGVFLIDAKINPELEADWHAEHFP